MAGAATSGRVAALALALSPTGCLFIQCKEQVDSREEVVLAIKAVEQESEARLAVSDGGELELRFDSATTVREEVAVRERTSSHLHAQIESRTADLVFGNEPDELPCTCGFGLVMLPGAILTPIVTGVVALAQWPFVGGTRDVDAHVRATVRPDALVDAELHDGDGRAFPLGAIGPEPRRLDAGALAASPLGPPPWRLEGRDARDGAPRSLPLAIDDEALGLLRSRAASPRPASRLPYFASATIFASFSAIWLGWVFGS